MFRSLLAAGLFAALLAGAGCRARVRSPGGATGSKPDQARKQAESLAVTAAGGAANAHARAQLAAALAKRGGNGIVSLAVTTATGMTVVQATGERTPPPPAATQTTAPPSPAPRTTTPRPAFRPGAVIVIKERVRSSMPYPNEADADEDALAVAADVIERRLAELDPPVNYRPTPNEVRNEFLRHDSRVVRGPTDEERADWEKYKIDTNRVYVEYAVEVTNDQVRELRTRDRVSDTLRVLGVLTAGFLAGHLFLLLDARTKGYLTRWLAVGAVTLALGAAAVLYLV